jgi:hypothetical protein
LLGLFTPTSTISARFLLIPPPYHVCLSQQQWHWHDSDSSNFGLLSYTQLHPTFPPPLLVFLPLSHRHLFNFDMAQHSRREDTERTSSVSSFLCKSHILFVLFTVLIS